MEKQKISIYIIIGISFVGVALAYNFFLYENLEETRTFNVSFLTHEEYIDRQVRNSNTGNPNADKILLKCGIDKHCIVEKLEELAKPQDESLVLESVNHIMQAFQRVGFYCHHQGHHIGMFLYGYLEDLPKTLASANRNCGGSMYHGILQNYFKSELSICFNGLGA